MVGLEDGNFAICKDTEAPATLPVAGDMLYLRLVPDDPSVCDITIGTGHSFGEADPKSRSVDGDVGGDVGGDTSGGGDTDGGGGDSEVGLGCEPANALTVGKAVPTQFVPGQCYSFNKSTGSLRFGNWSGSSFSVDIDDSAANTYSASVASGAWAEVGGVATGPFSSRWSKVSRRRSIPGNSIPARLSARAA